MPMSHCSTEACCGLQGHSDLHAGCELNLYAGPYWSQVSATLFLVDFRHPHPQLSFFFFSERQPVMTHVPSGKGLFIHPAPQTLGCLPYGLGSAGSCSHILAKSTISFSSPKALVFRLTFPFGPNQQMQSHTFLSISQTLPANFRVEGRFWWASCPRGVKVTSGLCLWSDPLGTVAITSRSLVWAGAEPGQWATAGHNISKTMGASPQQSGPTAHVFTEEALPLIQCGLMRSWFSCHFGTRKVWHLLLREKSWP